MSMRDTIKYRAMSNLGGTKHSASAQSVVDGATINEYGDYLIR